MKTRYKAQRIEIARRFEQLNEMLGTTSKELCQMSGAYRTSPMQCDGTNSSAGSISERDMKKICKTFGVNFEWLLEGKGEPFPGKGKNLPQHYFNVFKQESNGVYTYLKTYKRLKSAMEYIRQAKSDGMASNYSIVETDNPIKVFKELKV